MHINDHRQTLSLTVSAVAFAASLTAAPAALAQDTAVRQLVLSQWAQNKSAWNARDAAGVGAAFSEGGSFRTATMHASVQGAEAVARAIGVTFSAFPDFQVQSAAPDFLDDRRIVERWTATGTWTQPFPAGPLAGVVPTGRRFTVQGVSLYEWDNGKISSYENYFNVLAMMAQIGAVAMPTAQAPGVAKQGEPR